LGTLNSGVFQTKKAPVRDPDLPRSTVYPTGLTLSGTTRSHDDDKLVHVISLWSVCGKVKGGYSNLEFK
jgi:hypothetical protein